jgi:thiol-disulfide isomerase/thioredoxin
MSNVLWYIKYNKNETLLFMNFTSILTFSLSFGMSVCYAAPPMMDHVMEDLEEIPEAAVPQEPHSDAKKKSYTSKPKSVRAHSLYEDLRFAAMNSNRATSLKESAPHRPTLVIFWGAFCGPCLREFPSLERLSSKIPQLKIVSVAVDGKNEYESKLPLFYLHQGPRDQNQRFLEKHGISGVPAFFLFSTQGKLLWSDVGAKEWDSSENIQKLQNFLQLTPRSVEKTDKIVKRSTQNKKKRRQRHNSTK